jgi:hypothetical protein
MDEREMFEKYAYQMGKRDFEQNEFGDYRNPFTQEPWNFWRASREALESARRTTPDRECEWKCDDIDSGTWESCCGEIWTFTDGGPVENRMLFCHRCGGKIKTARTSDQNQCDGCAISAPLTVRGNHAMPDGGFMGCTRDRYKGG